MQSQEHAHRLRHMHTPQAISERLAEDNEVSYMRDAVLGAIDGCITTFALVAGATGAGFPTLVAFILGIASLLADGFSMAVSNFQAARTERGRLTQAYRRENEHIEKCPEGEIEEVRQIFAMKGFDGEVLEQIVATITADRKLWLDTMVQEEFGLSLSAPDPWKAAMFTFWAFVVVGFVPLLPFLLQLPADLTFGISTALTCCAFFLVGAVRGRLMDEPPVRAGLEMLAIGAVAALLAYGLGFGLEAVLAP